MHAVYIVTHAHEMPDGHDDVKFIGVYDSLGSAEAAVQRASVQPGFAQTKDGFHVEEYQLGKDHWKEGFFTYLE